ncbi:MAG: RNA polymerase sigma factor [bacterium]|nr:RNA polymerase sigma factor [bacterium]
MNDMVQGGIIDTMLGYDGAFEALQSERDESLLSRSLSSPVLFEILVRRYEDAFLRKARSIVRDERLAEDIVQEAFTKIYVHGVRFNDEGEGSFKAWGYAIVTNTALTYYNKQKRRREHTAELSPEHYESLSDEQATFIQESDVVKDFVVSILTRLPQQARDILTRVYIEDKPHKEIADEEGVSVQVIKTRAFRARAAFKKMLDSMQ